MSSVRIESVAFGDERYARLADGCGLADADHARGKMARLWRQCTTEKRYVLDDRDVILVLGERGPDALIDARLGDRVDGGIRIRGTRGRIEWREKLRKNGQKGGRPKKTKRFPSGFRESNPPAPAPVTAPSPDQEKKREPAAPVGLFPAEPPRPDQAQSLAVHAAAEISRVSGRHYGPSKAVIKLCRALVRDGHGPPEVTLVAEHKAREWLGGKLDARVCPATLLAATNFANYLDEARAGPIRAVPVGTGSHRPATGLAATAEILAERAAGQPFVDPFAPRKQP